MTFAAPNRARIRARCEDVRLSPQSARKCLLRLRLDEVQTLRGGQFLEAGQTVDAFVFDLTSPPEAGDTIRAEAEYLGGPQGGPVQLYDVRREEGDPVEPSPRRGDEHVEQVRVVGVDKHREDHGVEEQVDDQDVGE